MADIIGTLELKPILFHAIGSKKLSKAEVKLKQFLTKCLQHVLTSRRLNPSVE